MAKQIQGKDGRFAGSIGAGRKAIPKSSDVPPAATGQAAASHDPDGPYAAMHTVFSETVPALTAGQARAALDAEIDHLQDLIAAKPSGAARTEYEQWLAHMQTAKSQVTASANALMDMTARDTAGIPAEYPAYGFISHGGTHPAPPQENADLQNLIRRDPDGMVNAWVLVPDRDQCILLDVPGTPFYNPVRRVVIGGTYERIASIESSPQPGPQYAVSGRNTLITETGRNVGASLDVNNGRAKDHSLIIGPADPASTRLLDEGIPSEGYVSTYSSGW